MDPVRVMQPTGRPRTRPEAVAEDKAYDAQWIRQGGRAMRCWEQVREQMSNLGEALDEKIIHHDLDSVYTSYRWLRAMLIDDEMRVSFSERGAKGNPWIESLWGRTKDEIGSRIAEASSLPALRNVFDRRFEYYNQRRRHSSIGYIPPREHLRQTFSALESEPQIAAAS